jgi:hypothetical protein
VTKYYIAADKASDGEIKLSYVPTAQMITNCFTKPPLKPTISNKCAAVGMIGMGPWNGLSMFGNGWGNGIGI